uniref:Uncharacterized protein n=1 Tax=Ditylenchus dipsaci TaxID=166011 RepID=A0A915DS85_9BILA
MTAKEKSTKFLIGISPGHIRLTDQQLEQITKPDKKNGNVHFTHIIRDTWLNVRERVVPIQASPTQQWEPLFSLEQLVIAREAVKHAEKGLQSST